MTDLDSTDDIVFVDAAGNWLRVTCPYCFEEVEIHLDPQTRGSLVQDCEVCCQPWQLFVERDADHQPIVRADRI